MKKLVNMYIEEKLYEHIPNGKRQGRDVLTGSNRAEDYVSAGSERLVMEGKFQSWWEDRSFVRATTEIYDMEMD